MESERTMKEIKLTVDDLDVDKKITLLILQEIANNVIAPIANKVCILWIITLIVWFFK